MGTTRRRSRINASGADVVFNTIVPPGAPPFVEELQTGFASRGGNPPPGTYFDENFLNMCPAAHVEGLGNCCLDDDQAVGDPFSQEPLVQYDEVYRRREVHGRQCVLGPLSRLASWSPPWWKRARW